MARLLNQGNFYKGSNAHGLSVGVIKSSFRTDYPTRMWLSENVIKNSCNSWPDNSCPLLHSVLSDGDKILSHGVVLGLFISHIERELRLTDGCAVDGGAEEERMNLLV